jgi:Uma2 family endonuclease
MVCWREEVDMSTVMQTPVQSGLVLDNVNWRDFKRWLQLLDGRRGLRVSYDRGTLEIMPLTFGHESIGSYLDRLVCVLTEELALPIASGGSTTLWRRLKRKGLEPDKCYWIANEAAVRGKDRIDLRTDPPPDLAIEVDITQSSVDRMGIHAGLGVTEIWRWRKTGLSFHVLQPSGKYTPVKSSLTFAGLLPADVERIVSLRGQQEENAVIRQFRAWVQQQFGTGKPPP